MAINRKVLVIEDDMLAGELLCEFLRSRNLECDVITQRKFYNVLFHELPSKYRLVITDLYMDDINGTEVYLWTKSAYPQMPVICYSASPEDSLVKFDDLIHKPIDQDELDRIVKKFDLL